MILWLMKYRVSCSPGWVGGCVWWLGCYRKNLNGSDERVDKNKTMIILKFFAVVLH